MHWGQIRHLRLLNCPLSSLRILATAEQPPGSPLVIVMAVHPITLYILNKLKRAQKEKCSASSNIKCSITDELEARSCFISSWIWHSSPLSLSGNLGTLPIRSINTHCRLFFVKKRLEESINTHDKMPGYSML